MGQLVVGRGRPAAVLASLAVALVASATAGGLVLAEENRAAGLAASLGAIALVWGGARARAEGAPRILLLDAVTERLADAALLGAIAWASLPEAPRPAAAAIAALAAGYLATYVRTRARALGFRLGPAPGFRALRLALVAAGLLAGVVEPALWAVVALAAYLVLVAALAVARQGEPR